MLIRKELVILDLSTGLAIVNLSRLQFAITVVTHFMFVTTTIGLYTITVIFELFYAFGKKENQETYGRLALFFAKIGFISFGLGVVTGMVMELQFGLNWSAYAAFFGDIIGVPISIETMSAFFLETVLLGLWRFSWGKINKKLHCVLGALVLGTSLFSVVFVISANAFMQHPVGFTIANGAATLDSFRALLTNPRYWPQVLHVFGGIMIAAGLVTAGISAWQILHKRDVEIFKKSIQIGLLLMIPFVFIQPVLGDQQIIATWETQPMKYSAIQETPQTIPDAENEDMNTIADHYRKQFDATVAASYQGEMTYLLPANFLFYSKYLMEHSGWLYMVVAALALILLHRKEKSIEHHPKMLIVLGLVMWLPYLSLILGWIVAEVGRYPFVVYGIFTQLDAVSPVMTLPKIITSLSIFAILDVTLLSSLIVVSHRVLLKGAPNLQDDLLETTQVADCFGEEERKC